MIESRGRGGRWRFVPLAVALTGVVGVLLPRCGLLEKKLEVPTSVSGKVPGATAMGYETCMACHDASGAEVGPHPADDNDQWVTLLTEEGRRGPTTSAIISHSIVYEVSCDRCHYADNPNGLTHYTADGEIPEEEEDGGGGPP